MIFLIQHSSLDLKFILDHSIENYAKKYPSACLIISEPFLNDFRSTLIPKNFVKILPTDLSLFNSFSITEWSTFENNLNLFLSFFSAIIFIGNKHIEESSIESFNLDFYIYSSLDNKDAIDLKFDHSIILKNADNSLLPMTDSFLFPHGQKAVTSIAFDPSGSRMFSGSNDFCVKMWDFHSLSHSSPHSFREISHEHLESYQIHSLHYGSLSDKLLVVNDSSQARIFSREGQHIASCPRGDVYLKDLKNTRGHVAPITAADWHSSKKENFVTSSRDGSVRIWNINDLTKQSELILVKSSKTHKLQPVTFVNFPSSLVHTASTDNIVRIYSIDKPLSRPTVEFSNGNVNGSEICSMACAPSNANIVAVRSTDDSLRVWDLRNTKSALKAHLNLPCKYSQTQVIFSPCGEYFLTGCQFQNGTGSLVVFDSMTLEIKSEITNLLSLKDSLFSNLKSFYPSTDSLPGVISINWQHKINQIFLGLSDGNILGLFDSVQSSKGMKMIKQSKKTHIVEDNALRQEKVYTPFSLPLYDEIENDPSLIKSKILRDAKATRQPEAPIWGQGIGGKIGTNATAKVMKRILGDRLHANEDPREALLKYSESNLATVRLNENPQSKKKYKENDAESSENE